MKPRNIMLGKGFVAFVIPLPCDCAAVPFPGFGTHWREGKNGNTMCGNY